MRAFVCACLVLAGNALADAPTRLRVGTSGDYPPFSQAKGDGFAGFDVTVARAYAADRGLALEFVRFAWPELAEAVAAERFDVAMSGVTVRPDRSALGVFSVPVLETSAVVLASAGSGADSMGDLDQRGMRIGVNAGGHLERVAKGSFRLATIVAIPNNTGVIGALKRGSVDAVVTDSVEAPLWQLEVEDTERIGPLTRDRKAYLVVRSRPELARDLDAWLLEREADGTLDAWRREHIPVDESREHQPRSPTLMATPLRALVATLDERLAVMPLVGAAKREKVLPIAAPRREAKVLVATVAAVRDAAETAGRAAPDEAAVRHFTQAQMDAAKAVQLAAVRDPAFAPPETLPDLDADLRPALLRIGERMARLLVALPEALPKAEVVRECHDGLRAPWLANAVEAAVCDALAALAAAPREALSQDGASQEAGYQR